MAIGIKPTALVAGFMVFLVQGCSVSRDFNLNGLTQPVGWHRLVSGSQESCSVVDGVYLNLGQGKQPNAELLAQARLDVALGHATPSLEMPDKVSIELNAETNMLNYHLHEPVNKDFATPVSCSEGWYTWTRTMEDEYVGDGGNLDYSIRKIEIAVATDGDLIVHLILDSQFSSFGIFKSRYKKEYWSKFTKYENRSD